MAYEYGNYGQADWFYGIKKAPQEFTCPPGHTKQPWGSGFRCLPPAPPPPPPSASKPAPVDAPPTDAPPMDAPPAPMPSGPAMPAGPVIMDDEGGILDVLAENWILVAGGLAAFVALTLVALKGGGDDEEYEEEYEDEAPAAPPKPKAPRIVIEMPGDTPAEARRKRRRRCRR